MRSLARGQYRFSGYVLPLLLGGMFSAFNMVSGQAAPSNWQALRYHGIRPGDPGGRDGLRNPERGLRVETLIAEPQGAKVWGPAAHLQGKVSPGYSDDWWIRDADHYEVQGLTLVQAYCYLDSYRNGPIPPEKLALLQKSLDAMRRHGYKALLRFAYERDTERLAGPELKTILAHMDQLAPIVRKNTDVIYVLQAGFIGAWGEWHSSAHELEKDHAALAAVTAKLLKILPPERMTQVRVPKYKRWILSEPVLGGYRLLDAHNAHTAVPAARIGYHDDGFLAGQTDGGTWPEPPHYGNPGNPEFDVMTADSPYVPVDGELFWADQAGKIDGLKAAERMCLQHYSSFSLAHSFSDREGKPYTVDDWMQQPLTEAQAREAKLPCDEGYFIGKDGEPAVRTAFEYIRDHLGYRLELREAGFPRRLRAGGTLDAGVDLINRGFSTLHNPRPVLFALIDSQGRVTSLPAANADPRIWQPFDPADAQRTPLVHRVTLKARLPKDLHPGRYRLGLWLPDAAASLRGDARYAVRCANRDVPWWTDAQGGYGINILGEVTVSR